MLYQFPSPQNPCDSPFKSRLNSHVKLTAENIVKDDIIYRHFNQPDNQGLRDVRIQLIDKGSNERSLREREAQWAYRLRTIYPLIPML